MLVPINTKPTRINFGRVERGDEAKKKTVTLTRGDGGPIHPEIVRAGSKEIAATLREVEPGERYDLDVEIKPPWPNKRLRSWVRVKTGVAKAPETSVPVYADVVPKVEATPQWFSVRLGSAKDLERSVRLQWHDKKSHEVQEVTVNDPELKVRVEDKNGGQMVVLTVPGGYQSPARTRTVTIKTGDEEVPILRVPVRFSGARRSAKANRKAPEPKGAQRAVTAKAPPSRRATRNAAQAGRVQNDARDSANAQPDAKPETAPSNAEDEESDPATGAERDPDASSDASSEEEGSQSSGSS